MFVDSFEYLLRVSAGFDQVLRELGDDVAADADEGVGHMRQIEGVEQFQGRVVLQVSVRLSEAYLSR